MKAFLAPALALLFVPASAQAQQVSGPAVAVDGDTLEMTGLQIRLFGIDAVEGGQTCRREGEAWACGGEARALLDQLVAGKVIECETRGSDDTGTITGICRAGRLDLAATLAEAGYVLSLDDAYLASVDGARSRKAGIWGSEFTDPAAWRAANPAPRSRRATPATDDAPAAIAAPYYRNCTEVRAAGAAPLYRGQRGYRGEMDGDGDGIACEPHRGLR